MPDKVYNIIMIVLSSIVAIILLALLIFAHTPVQVDCTKIKLDNEVNKIYTPLPKQCEKGE